MKILENINGTTAIDITIYSTDNKCKSKPLKCDLLQNVACHSIIGGICPFTASSTVQQSAAMTDEDIKPSSENKADDDYKEISTIANQTKECNKSLPNDSDPKAKLENNDSTLTDTEKIFLKNGLNGTNDTAAAAVVATATSELLTAPTESSLPFLPYMSTTDPKPKTNAADNTQSSSPTSLVVLKTSLNNCIQENAEFVSLRRPAVNSPHLTLRNRLLDCNSAAATTITTTTTSTTSTSISTTLINSNKLHKLKKKVNLSKTSLMNLGIVDYSISNSTATTLTSKFLLTPTDTKLLSSIHPRSNDDKSTALNYNNSVRSYFDNNFSIANNGYLTDNKTTKTDKTFTSHSQHVTSFCHANSVYNNGVPLKSSIIKTNTVGHVYGGRLEFFKDGKFILELALSKIGGKSGWVSVPRKQFRAPSAATSSTVIPSSLANFAVQSPLPTLAATNSHGAAFSKNECSNSLSLSDDNSSVQSSPWQQDRCWKQPAPQKNISKEMSLLYQRLRWVQLTPQGRNWSRIKRRKPYDATVLKDGMLFQDRVHEFCKSNAAQDTLPADELKSIEEELNTKSNINRIDQNLEECLSSNKSPLNTEVNGDISLAEKKANISKASDTQNRDEAIHKYDIENNNSNGVQIVSKIIPTNKMTQSANKTSSYKAKINLSTIVQKLLELSCKHSMMSTCLPPPAPFSNRSSAAVCTSISFTASHLQNYKNNTSGRKSSSTSLNLAATRLVDCHHQHVSPRKRILREFEKVSLEDNNTIAGGKRSRAKCNISNAETSSTSVLGNNSNSNSKHSPAQFPCSSHSSAVNKSTTACTSAPTRLCSSYSILSLLGGTADISRCIKKNDPAAIGYNNTHKDKSPTTVGHEVNRSPPCISPTCDSHSRSPTAFNPCAVYGMLSPRNSTDAAQRKFQKLHAYAPNSDSTTPSLNHANQNYMHLSPIDTHHQNYYSPYMTSPHYMYSRNISMTNASSAPAAAAAAAAFCTSNSTRCHTSAFKAAASTTVISSAPLLTSASVYIPIQDLSPARSLTASSRDAIARTVPKKTASTRRQFSPNPPTTAHYGMTHYCYTSASLSRHGIHDDLKNTDTRIVTPSISQYQNQIELQKDSTSSDATASNLHSYPYIYPPIVNINSDPLAMLTTNAAASTVSSYIPSVISSSYYHPYISTLAAMRHSQMWMQNYQDSSVVAVGVAPSGASPPLIQIHQQPAVLANSRLSPRYHQSLQYNGISSAAAMAAAVVAAAGFGNPTTLPSTTILPVVTTHTPFFVALRGAGHEERSSFDAYNSTTSNSENSMNESSDKSSSFSSNAFKISPSTLSQASSFSLLHTSSFSSTSTSNSTYQLNHKIEQIADVPLNLSKH